MNFGVDWCFLLVILFKRLEPCAICYKYCTCPFHINASHLQSKLVIGKGSKQYLTIRVQCDRLQTFEIFLLFFLGRFVSFSVQNENQVLFCQTFDEIWFKTAWKQFPAGPCRCQAPMMVDWKTSEWKCVLRTRKKRALSRSCWKGLRVVWSDYCATRTGRCFDTDS